jgi:hypothetical protein
MEVSFDDVPSKKIPKKAFKHFKKSFKSSFPFSKSQLNKASHVHIPKEEPLDPSLTNELSSNLKDGAFHALSMPIDKHKQELLYNQLKNDKYMNHYMDTNMCLKWLNQMNADAKFWATYAYNYVKVKKTEIPAPQKTQAPVQISEEELVAKRGNAKERLKADITTKIEDENKRKVLIDKVDAIDVKDTKFNELIISVLKDMQS